MNKVGRKLIATIVGCAMFAFSGPSWAQQSLKVAGAKPWVVHDPGSNASGLFVDLMNAVAKDADLKVDYESMIFADLIPALKDGKIDISATFMAITPGRREQVDFSVPIYNAPTEAVVVKANDTTSYKTLADLKGRPVGAQKGSIQLALLQRTGGFSAIKTYDTINDAWAAAASGAVAAAVTAGADTIYDAKQGELTNLRIVSSYQSPSSRPQVGIAVRKGNRELLAKLNDALVKLERDGSIKAIFGKYGFNDWAPPK